MNRTVLLQKLEFRRIREVSSIFNELSQEQVAIRSVGEYYFLDTNRNLRNPSRQFAGLNPFPFFTLMIFHTVPVL